MEACFLTPNSVAKTFDLVPILKARPVSSPVRKSISLSKGKRVAIPSSITRCHMSEYSPLDEDRQPFPAADWRSFRARLVTNEPAIMINDDDQSSDPDAAAGENPPLTTVRDKWAHPIREPEKGCLLIASEKLDGDHIFERTVILLLSTGPVGVFGVILNRPSLMSVKEMRSAVIDTSGTFSDRPLFFGGPLEEGLFLVSPRGGYDMDRVAKSGVFEEVMKGLYYGTKESAGCASEMVKRNVVGVGDFRFYDGYCGWGKQQLREEINCGYWTMAACSSSVIGQENMSARGLWEEVRGLMVPQKVRESALV